MYPFIFSIIWYFGSEKKQNFGMTFADSIAEATKNVEEFYDAEDIVAINIEEIGDHDRGYAVLTLNKNIYAELRKEYGDTNDFPS